MTTGLVGAVEDEDILMEKGMGKCVDAKDMGLTKVVVGETSLTIDRIAMVNNIQDFSTYEEVRAQIFFFVCSVCVCLQCVFTVCVCGVCFGLSRCLRVYLSCTSVYS